MFRYGMVGKFTARRHWEIFRSAGKELENFVLSHGAVDVPNFIFWILPVTNSSRNGLSGDLVSSGLLHTNSLKQDTGHFLSPVSYALGRKDLWCSFSSPWRVLLSLSLSVVHSSYSSPLASPFSKRCHQI